MSEKRLTEPATQCVIDARARMAESAERAIELWLAWCGDSGNVDDGTWDAFRIAVAEYKDAREAVRKMGERT